MMELNASNISLNESPHHSQQQHHNKLHIFFQVSKIALCILLISGVIVHLFGIYVLQMARSRSKRKFSNHNFILTNLSIAEIFLNISLLAHQFIKADVLLKVVEGLADMLFLTHGSIMTFIALNRWLVLHLKIRYSHTINRTVLKLTISIIWLASLCFALPQQFISELDYFEYNKEVRVGFHGCFIICTGVIYYKIYRSMKGRKKFYTSSEPVLKQTQFLVASMIIVTFIVFFSLADVLMMILKRIEIMNLNNRHEMEHLFMLSSAFGVLSDAIIYIFFKPKTQMKPQHKISYFISTSYVLNSSSFHPSPKEVSKHSEKTTKKYQTAESKTTQSLPKN